MIVEIDTPLGLARAHVTDGGTRGTLVLGHGAGGGIESADLVEVTAEAAAGGGRGVRGEEPLRVAGRAGRAALAGGRQAHRRCAAPARRGVDRRPGPVACGRRPEREPRAG